MISAYADAYRVLGSEEYLKKARRALRHVTERMRAADSTLLRSYRGGRTSGAAYQEDYAFLIRGFLSLYEATDDGQYLTLAITLQETADRLFWDPIGHGYFFGTEAEDLIARRKSTHDAAIPSGNAEAIHNLIGLTEATGNRAYLTRAGKVLTRYAHQMEKILPHTIG